MSLVSKIKVEGNLKKEIEKVVELRGGFSKFIKKGDKVLLKPNFNTADPFPASSDPEFIRAVIELTLAVGAKQVIVGDSSTIYQNTRRNMKKLGIFKFKEIDPRVKVISFDEGEWIKKEIKGGRYLKYVSVPEVLDQVDKIIFLPCIKTHFIAKFTGALKLGVGLMKPIERLRLHAKNTEEKIAEMNLVFCPDLIIMDGRKCFITKGPTKGEVREPRLILAATDRIAIDIEAVKIIKSYPGNDLENFKIEDLLQIKRAREIINKS